MDLDGVIETALRTTVDGATHAPAPPKLAAAVRHAVFSGGSRVRPLVCLTVAAAAAGGRPITPAQRQLGVSAAIAIELFHCASLVHDDLPCFDDADMRRGRPTVHRAYGEEIAVLAGDALIVLACEAVATAATNAGPAALPVLRAVMASAGMPGGIVAGQAWESEAAIDLDAYHRAKTGALFVAAAVAGAEAMGNGGPQWSRFGAHLGAAYQIADDLKDVLAPAAELGKPSGQDARNGRPNAVVQLGARAAFERLETELSAARSHAPPGPAGEPLRMLISRLDAKVRAACCGAAAASAQTERHLSEEFRNGPPLDPHVTLCASSAQPLDA